MQADSLIQQDTTENLESSASLQADSLGQWVNGLDAQARSIASSETLNAESETQLYTGLHRERRHHSDTTAIHYFDAESGEMITSTLSAYREEGLSLEEIDQPWADASIRDELVTDRTVWRSNTSYDSADIGSQVMAFAVRDATDPNKVVVVEGTIDLRVRYLHQPGLNHSTTIVNVHGETVLGAEDGGTDVPDQRTVQDAVDRTVENGTVQFVEHGDTLRAYAPVVGTDWVAVTSVPASDAYVVRDAVGWNVLLIVISGLVTLSAVGVVLGRQTVTPLARLRERADQMRQGNLEVDLETNRADEIGQLFGAFDSMRTSLRERIHEAETARDEVNRTNRHLESKAAEYSEVMRACADGDFTHRMNAASENEAMTDIAREFNQMIAEIERTTEQLKSFATDVATASEQVTASTEEVRAASYQVSESVQAISDGSERQNESLQSVDFEIDNLSSTIEEIAASSNEVADLAERTAQTGESGRETADTAVEGMNEIERESERAVEEIEALEAEIERIDELLEFITQVSDKTNMLALNANIEASRSSQGGDSGFGVVALEIKELAAETKDAASNIETITGEIKDQTHRTAAEVQQTSEQVAAQREAVEETVAALEEIATYAQETNDGVQDISAATEEQAASTEEVVAMVDQAASISEESAAEAENVAAAAEEQTSSLTEVSQSALELARQASNLSTELEQFETDAGIVGDGDSSNGESDRADSMH
ncbi:methyl-accepting chemotaxis protein [Natronobiforma cellulositropha]|uniref:methyl-accepting chemotaxis protein n=1 Tax=Natronobiforma cellulositropha TaxID=1679076 RepID=UPI0021D5B093|nr:methyl-accepting chemotaxis protein [Natronobiforma cellulositropha]